MVVFFIYGDLMYIINFIKTELVNIKRENGLYKSYQPSNVILLEKNIVNFYEKKWANTK